MKERWVKRTAYLQGCVSEACVTTTEGSLQCARYEGMRRTSSGFARSNLPPWRSPNLRFINPFEDASHNGECCEGHSHTKEDVWLQITRSNDTVFRIEWLVQAKPGTWVPLVLSRVHPLWCFESR